MKIDSLRTLFIEELRDLYDAENRILEALPKMSQAASASELKQAFDHHLTQTQGQVERLEKVFEQLGESPKGKACKAMQGLIAEGQEMIKQKGEPAAKDAGLIACAQRVEHYEIAGYGTVRSYAKLLKETQCAKLLQETLDEEGQTDQLLTQLAESLINVEAL